MRILLISFLALCPALCGAQSAAELYNSGDYAAAAAAYEQRLKDEPQNPYALYNLGNSYFSAGEVAKAIANYYRAFNILPRDAQIRANLSHALNATGQSLVPPGVPAAAFNIYYYLSMAELKGLCALAAWFAALAAVFYTVKKRKKPLIIALAVFVFCAAWYAARATQAGKRLAVSAQNRGEVRAGPGDSFAVSQILPKAYLVVISDEMGPWAQVQTGPGGAGWILKTSLEEI